VKTWEATVSQGTKASGQKNAFKNLSVLFSYLIHFNLFGRSRTWMALENMRVIMGSLGGSFFWGIVLGSKWWSRGGEPVGEKHGAAEGSQGAPLRADMFQHKKLICGGHGEGLKNIGQLCCIFFGSIFGKIGVGARTVFREFFAKDLINSWEGPKHAENTLFLLWNMKPTIFYKTFFSIIHNGFTCYPWKSWTFLKFCFFIACQVFLIPLNWDIMGRHCPCF